MYIYKCMCNYLYKDFLIKHQQKMDGKRKKKKKNEFEGSEKRKNYFSHDLQYRDLISPKNITFAPRSITISDLLWLSSRISFGFGLCKRLRLCVCIFTFPGDSTRERFFYLLSWTETCLVRMRIFLRDSGGKDEQAIDPFFNCNHLQGSEQRGFLLVTSSLKFQYQ